MSHDAAETQEDRGLPEKENPGTAKFNIKTAKTSTKLDHLQIGISISTVTKQPNSLEVLTYGEGKKRKKHNTSQWFKQGRQ
jgi:hypothetical protein